MEPRIIQPGRLNDINAIVTFMHGNESWEEIATELLCHVWAQEDSLSAMAAVHRRALEDPK